MAKKKSGIKVSIDVRKFSVRNLKSILSDVEFLTQIHIKPEIQINNPLVLTRHIQVDGTSMPYTLRYFVTDFDLMMPTGSEEYTHAQVRDMKSAEKRKHS